MMEASAANSSDENHVHGNITIDVTIKGCFWSFDPVACIRNGVITAIALGTLGVCIYKLFTLSMKRHPTVQIYVIFVLAILECVLIIIHSMIRRYVQVEFVINYLKLVQLLLVTHVYWNMAALALRRELLISRVILPLLIALFTFFTAFLMAANTHIGISWLECMKPYWVVFSGTELGLVQLFMVSAIFINVRLNEISTLESARKQQKCFLWLLVSAFEFSAICGLMYHLMLIILADATNGCSGVFKHKQVEYSIIFGCFMVIKFFFPIWVMVAVFRPHEMHPDHEEILPAINEDWEYASGFAPISRHPRFPIYRGSNDLHTDDTSPILTPEGSSPIFVPRSRRSSHLASITEEDATENAAT